MRCVEPIPRLGLLLSKHFFSLSRAAERDWAGLCQTGLFLLPELLRSVTLCREGRERGVSAGGTVLSGERSSEQPQ